MNINEKMVKKGVVTKGKDEKGSSKDSVRLDHYYSDVCSVDYRDTVSELSRS